MQHLDTVKRTDGAFRPIFHQAHDGHVFTIKYGEGDNIRVTNEHGCVTPTTYAYFCKLVGSPSTVQQRYAAYKQGGMRAVLALDPAPTLGPKAIYPQAPTFTLLQSILREPRFSAFTARRRDGEIRLSLTAFSAGSNEAAERSAYYTDSPLDAIGTLYAWQRRREGLSNRYLSRKVTRSGRYTYLSEHLPIKADPSEPANHHDPEACSGSCGVSWCPKWKESRKAALIQRMDAIEAKWSGRHAPNDVIAQLDRIIAELDRLTEESANKAENSAEKKALIL